MERDQNGTKLKVRKEPVLDYLHLVKETVGQWERFLLTRHTWTSNATCIYVHYIRLTQYNIVVTSCGLRYKEQEDLLEVYTSLF